MPARREYGEGTIYQRKDGRWAGSLCVNGARRSVYGKTEKEAREKLKALRQQAESAALPAAGRRTFEDLIDTWLASAPDIRETTRREYLGKLKTHAYPALRRERLERITPDRLQHLYAPLTPAVADRLHRILHRAFAVAVRWRWLPDNPCDRVLKPAYRAAEKAVWSVAQAQTFLAAIEGEQFGPLFVLLMTTGLRLGEALALRWQDVGLGVAVNVGGTLHRVDGAPVIGKPKTASSRRTVLLPPLARQALQRQAEQQARWHAAAPEVLPKVEFVFATRTGKPVYPSHVQRVMRRLCRKLELPALSPHGLRHMHASLLIHEGLPITAVSARLGHANPSITMKLYAHALPGQDAQAAEAINRALAGASATVEARR